MLRDAMISASNHITNNKSAVDALNVFPVPDGDTGTNMALTMQSAAKAMQKIPDGEQVSRVAELAASALLRGARGNSGVILSLIFKGIAEGLRGCVEASGTSVSAALTLGSENAYKAVMKPTEGTILTVVRFAAEKASVKAATGADALEVFEEACEAAEDVLRKTPEMLVELRRAKVVDAGGQGLLLIFQAMMHVFKNNEMVTAQEPGEAVPAGPPEFAGRAMLFDAQDIKFAYCTEFIINKNKTSFLDALLLRSYLESIGDCVVVVEDDDIVKVHVHANDPGNVLTKALEYGELVNVKIDNMKQQHKNASWGLGDKIDEKMAEQEGEQVFDKPFGFVTVCAGEGLEALFADLGADAMVSGGQTMNPSTDDLLHAIQKVNAEQVFVLPNNKNIIMAAKQAIPLANRQVTLIPTTDIPQGISAMLQFDESASLDENIHMMQAAAKRVRSALITYAARNSYVNGQSVKQGDILGIENGKITLVDTNAHNAALRCARHLIGKNAAVVTLIFGNSVSEEQAEQVAEKIRAKSGSGTEVTTVFGGQPVYFYIISVE
jgi:DAK2 domain fusion protein YloV